MNKSICIYDNHKYVYISLYTLIWYIYILIYIYIYVEPAAWHLGQTQQGLCPQTQRCLAPVCLHRMYSQRTCMSACARTHARSVVTRRHRCCTVVASPRQFARLRPSNSDTSGPWRTQRRRSPLASVRCASTVRTLRTHTHTHT